MKFSRNLRWESAVEIIRFPADFIQHKYRQHFRQLQKCFLLKIRPVSGFFRVTKGNKSLSHLWIGKTAVYQRAHLVILKCFPICFRYLAGKIQDMDFLSEAFSLLSHARDLNDSLNILMERIGRQYDLGRVAVVECDKQRKELIQTNCWTRENGIVNGPEYVDKYKNWDIVLSNFDESGLACIDDWPSCPPRAVCAEPQIQTAF